MPQLLGSFCRSNPSSTLPLQLSSLPLQLSAGKPSSISPLQSSSRPLHTSGPVGLQQAPSPPAGAVHLKPSPPQSESWEQE